MDNYRRPSAPSSRHHQTLDGFAARRSLTMRQPQLAVPLARPAPATLPNAPKVEGSPTQSDTSMPTVEVGAYPVGQKLPPLDMALPISSAAAPHTGRLSKPKTKWQITRRWAFRTVAVGLVLVVAIGGVLVSEGYLKLHKVFKGSAAHDAALVTNVDPSLLKGEGSGRINVLLMGIGGGGHDGPDLTDTMMLASIDPVNHAAVLLSIPRDMWVTIPHAGNMKINAAYETGKYRYLGKISADNSNSQATEAGFSSVDQVVENVIGVPIDYNVLVDFQAFRQAVNTVGGVTVNVPSELYDPTMAWENGYNPVLAKPGIQTFDGVHALIYVRSRETTSDFARGLRQRAVMLALKQKATTLGTLSDPTKLSGLINAFGNNVQTDLSISDGSRLYSIFQAIDNSNIESLDLDTAPNLYVTTADVQGQSTVQPKAGMFNFGDIQTFVRSQLQDGYLKKENANLMVLNGTTEPGLATAKAAELKSYGYNIGEVSNAPTSGYAQTVLVDLSGGKDKYTKHYLEQRFNTKAVSQIPDKTIAPGAAHFILILGNDQTSTIQN